MTRRTFILFALLLAAAVAALYFRPRTQGVAAEEAHGNAPAPAATTPTDTPQAAYARIDDTAKILAPFEGKLSRMADAFFDDLGIDLHVVTRLDTSASIEAQADRIFQERKIGVGAPTGGLLVVLNPSLAQARIEVGYTLEGGLADLHMGRIARDQLAPYASYGIAGMAVMDVLHYLRDHVYAAAALGNIGLNEALKTPVQLSEYRQFMSGGAGARAKLSSLPIDTDFKRRVPDDVRARYAPSRDVEESVSAFLRATADFVGDPTLDLFTEGSRLMRAHYPFAPFEEIKRLERIDASKPLEVIVRDDYAVATSKRPARGFMPVLLHRERGLWRIDSVETWKNLFFHKDGNYFLRNANTPYAPLLTQFGEGRYYNIDSLRLATGSIADDLALLQAKTDVVSITRRGDLWFRNTFVFAPAFKEFEAARAAAPRDPFVLELIGARALYLGFPELAIPAYEPLGRGVEMTIAEAYEELGQRDGGRHWIRQALAENPYDLHALQWQQHLDRADGKPSSDVTATLTKLANDARRPANPVVLYFHPRWPRYEPQKTTQVNGAEVFDHSDFGVTLRNTSNRTVEIESVMLTSLGDAAASGLGDIKGYWRFPAGAHRLGPDESVYFKKVWGFTVDTGHSHVRYVFRTCWHGIGSELRQCRTQWVDVLPD